MSIEITHKIPRKEEEKTIGSEDSFSERSLTSKPNEYKDDSFVTKRSPDGNGIST